MQLSSSDPDSIVFQEASQLLRPDEHVFTERKWVFVNDSNMQNYTTSIVTIETINGLAQSGRLPNYKEGLIQIPMVTIVNGAGAPNNNTDLCFALKNSYLNFIHSFTIDINGAQVVNAVPYSNVLLLLNQHIQYTPMDEQLNGPLTNYYPDNPESWGVYANAMATASPCGNGICNNNNIPNVGENLLNVKYINDGILKRQQQFLNSSNGKSLVLGATPVDLCQNRIDNANTAGANDKIYYYMATIPLASLSDIFEGIPLTKNLNLKITLNLNTNIRFTVTKTVTPRTSVGPVAGFSTMIAAQGNFSNSMGYTNPFMLTSSYITIDTKSTDSSLVEGTLASVRYAQGGNCLAGQASGNANPPAAVASQILVQSGICSATNGANVYSHTVRSCRLYVPTYITSPEAYDKYTAENKIVRSFDFTDTTFHQFDIAPGSVINQVVSPSSQRAYALVMVPFLTEAASSNDGINALSSPFTCEPCLPSPFRASQLNVMIGTQYLYPQNISYGYEQYLQNLDSLGLNSNKSRDGLVSGVLNKRFFENGMPYYVIYLDRRLMSDELVAQSISVTFKSESLLAYKMYCYILRRKSISINILTGQKVS
jgi:hypothetical protein